MFYSKKSLGQNFLQDQNIIKKIINLKNIKNKDIVEIGPGNGAITDKILNHGPKSLIATLMSGRDGAAIKVCCRPSA